MWQFKMNWKYLKLHSKRCFRLSNEFEWFQRFRALILSHLAGKKTVERKTQKAKNDLWKMIPNHLAMEKFVSNEAQFSSYRKKQQNTK